MERNEQEQRRELERMGEPPSSVEYLTRTLIFNGEAVTVAAPNWVSQKDEE